MAYHVCRLDLSWKHVSHRSGLSRGCTFKKQKARLATTLIRTLQFVLSIAVLFAQHLGGM